MWQIAVLICLAGIIVYLFYFALSFRKKNNVLSILFLFAGLFFIALTINVSADLTEEEWTTFDGSVNITRNLTVQNISAQNIDVAGNINATSTFYGTDIDVSGDLDVTGNVTITNNLTVGTANKTLFIDAYNSRVGIGTDTPAYDLDIYNAGIAQMRFSGDFPLIGLVDLGAGGVPWNIENGREAPGILGFYSTGGTQVVFDSTGKVGMGTKSPDTDLELAGSGATQMRITGGSAGGFPLFSLKDEESGGVIWNIENGREGDGKLGFYTGGTKITFTSAGDVGIGTASPASKLHIVGDSLTSYITFAGSGTGDIKMGTTGGGGEYGALWANQATPNVSNYAFLSGGGITVFNNPAGHIYFTEANTNVRMIIRGTTGYIGINTTTPQNTLNVVGDLNVTGLIINDAIYCESSELNDQPFAVTGVPYRINISNVDEGNGISMATGNNGTNITIDTSGVYHMVAQPQVKAGPGSAGDFHMWLEKFSSGTWADVPDSNIELKLSSLEEDVIVLATTLKLNQGEKLRLVASVSDNGILLHAQSPVGEPIIPSIIFTMYRIGS